MSKTKVISACTIALVAVPFFPIQGAFSAGSVQNVVRLAQFDRDEARRRNLEDFKRYRKEAREAKTPAEKRRKGRKAWEARERWSWL